jgi:three-Cys-motif partner protein
VAVPKETVWPRDPHTGAKHQILDRYYGAWFPILLHSPYWDSLTVLDAYAGPGEYTGGEEGSPIIALRALFDRPNLVAIGKPIRFCFIEERGDRVAHLENLVERLFPAADRPGHVSVKVRQGSCESHAIPLLTEVGAWGHPIFANLDPFDAGVPYGLVERLGSNPASEAFVTFMSDWLRRFASEEHIADGDQMFGEKEWRKVRDLPDPPSKEQFLVGRYRKTLGRAGLDKTSAFKLIDEGGRAFWLIHGTGHIKGIEKMKDAMWDADPVSGFRFRDPRDPNQAALFESTDWAPEVSALGGIILEQLEAVGRPMSLDDIREFALLQTVYRGPHATQATQRLLKEKRLRREPETGRLNGSTLLSLPGA